VARLKKQGENSRKSTASVFYPGHALRHGEQPENIMAQSILNYIARNRAGLARQVVEEVLRACGHKPEVLNDPKVGELRGRIEIVLLTSVGWDGLEEPTPIADSRPEPDVAGQAPASRDAAQITHSGPPPQPAAEGEEPLKEPVEMPGAEVLIMGIIDEARPNI
jgi:hypothetical protein